VAHETGRRLARVRCENLPAIGPSGEIDRSIRLPPSGYGTRSCVEDSRSQAVPRLCATSNNSWTEVASPLSSTRCGDALGSLTGQQIGDGLTSTPRRRHATEPPYSQPVATLLPRTACRKPDRKRVDFPKKSCNCAGKRALVNKLRASLDRVLPPATACPAPLRCTWPTRRPSGAGVILCVPPPDDPRNEPKRMAESLSGQSAGPPEDRRRAKSC